LRIPLPETAVRLLAAISETTGNLGIDYFIIGATARDIILNHLFVVGIQRATRDIDFGIAVRSWDEFALLKSELAERFDFRFDRNIEHRLHFGDDLDETEVDLVPFGGVANVDGAVVFPRSGLAMNIAGFSQSFSDCLKLEVSDDLTINVASLAGIVVLKFVAYDDRPQERSDDLTDILFIARKYLDAGNESRLYDRDIDVLNEDAFDTRTAGARLLGRDLARLLDDETRRIILSHLLDLDQYSDADSKIIEQLRIGIEE
jgi:predicted nucleotidyltransferase